jgi:hypothetical protein
MKWSAFAAEFEEIDENVEYIEKETEFDQVSGNAVVRPSVSSIHVRKIKKKLQGEREQQRRRMSTLEPWKMLLDLKEVVALCWVEQQPRSRHFCLMRRGPGQSLTPSSMSRHGLSPSSWTNLKTNSLHRFHSILFDKIHNSDKSETTLRVTKDLHLEGCMWLFLPMSTISKAAKSTRYPRGFPRPPPRHGPRPRALPTASRPIHPSNLVARQGNGFTSFVPQLRKLIFEYCERSEQSAKTRGYLLNYVEDVARSNPHVEVVVKTRTLKPPIVRGLYRKFSTMNYILHLV